jgi:hypothetical protein
MILRLETQPCPSTAFLAINQAVLEGKLSLCNTPFAIMPLVPGQAQRQQVPAAVGLGTVLPRRRFGLTHWKPNVTQLVVLMLSLAKDQCRRADSSCFKALVFF